MVGQHTDAVLTRLLGLSQSEIETLKAQAEVQPLVSLAGQLSALKGAGEGTLGAYVRSVRLGLFSQAQQVIQETKR